MLILKALIFRLETFTVGIAKKKCDSDGDLFFRHRLCADPLVHMVRGKTGFGR